VTIALSWTRQQMELGGMTQEEADAYVAKIRGKARNDEGAR